MDPPGISPNLDVLDAFLLSDAAPDDCMQLSELDGFLTGILVGPEVVMPSEWLPKVWGGTAPEFETLEQAQAILGAIMGRYNEIAGQLNSEEPIEPVFWENSEGQTIADDWALGFLDAVRLRLDGWQPLLKDRKERMLMGPILLLAGDPEDVEQPTDEEIDQSIEFIPAAVAGIREFWRDQQAKKPKATERPVQTSRKRPGGRR